MAEKTIRQEVLDILKRGESWIDRATGKQYTAANMDELPSEGDFTQGNEEEAKKSLAALDEELLRIMRAKEDVLRASGMKEPVKVEKATEEKVEDKSTENAKKGK